MFRSGISVLFRYFGFVSVSLGTAFQPILVFTVYCFCREMMSPGGSCFPLCNLLKNSVTSGVILKVNMSLFGCKLLSTCVSRSQWCRNVHSQGVYLIMS